MRVFAGQHLTAQRDADGAFLIRWDTPNSSINQHCEDLLAEWNLLLDKLEQWPRLTLVILASGKKGTFGRGWLFSDLDRLGNENRLAALTETWDAILNRWEKLPCPTLATIAGPCTDEAMDVAMACDYRVAYQSGSAQIGWTSSFRGWVPPPSTCRRLLSHAGIERFARLVILGQTLNATEACAWGLVNIAATGEEGLRNAINRLRQRAFLRGKIIRREPASWSVRAANCSQFCRNWIMRGLKRILDRITSLEHPIIGHAWKVIERSIHHPDWQDIDGSGSVNDLSKDTGGKWIRSARTSGQPVVSSSLVPKVGKVFLLGESSLEYDIARKALSDKIPVVVGAQSAEQLGRRVMRLGAEANVPPAAALKMIDGKLVSDLVRVTPSKQDIILGIPSAPEFDWVKWSREGALLMVDAKNSMDSGALLIRSLSGNHRSGWLELSEPDSLGLEWLTSLGFRAHSHCPSSSIWRVAGAWWAETLRAMAEGLDPFVIEQEARRIGFLQGPLADLSGNTCNLAWAERLVAPEDADLLARWREMLAKPSGVQTQSPKVVGWWAARRWRRRCGVKLSPLLQAMPNSARVASLGTRWMAAITMSCDMNDSRDSSGLATLEARVGWPVFRGPPWVALTAMGESLESIAMKLAKTFGQRFLALNDRFGKDGR